ncbi:MULTISPECIES: hypothetical protein [Xanthomonas translucens group]|uniref:hypothetical protein n=1 Tax=Xanthomonas translucens group TaxID=3390202 RepID=UPI00056DE513|nr:hypothetical protein [Xanthomonas translucens]MCC8445676.1 hypothetical protein [Xanthomonas translucens pv. translucens]MCT8286285.1 hypothetical protein [Xanthomonas translucens pv. translucens]MCT8303943.1 hypothetical protein [Xanthomonas translucens pv. translucens]UKE48505.1 hypothetical protein KHA79_07865 [Xanthomonas translucens pv. cerealis]UNT99574.1 hypothetical protein KBQ49_02330 [Xanthomonas translucens pv. translucens]
MSYSEYIRGVQNERFANQLQIQRLSRSVDEWAAYARRKEAEVVRLLGKLSQLRAENILLANAQQDGLVRLATMADKLTASEDALIDARECAAERVRAFEVGLDHLKDEYDWMASVAMDPLNRGTEGESGQRSAACIHGSKRD